MELDFGKYQISNDDDCLEFARHMQGLLNGKSDVVIVCIGSMLCAGDSVAPRIGSELENLGIKHYIYGNENKTVNARNLSETLDEINERFVNPFVIAIDASIGTSIGSVIVQNAPIFPGKGVGKVLPCVGDISIQCVVTSRPIELDLFRFDLEYFKIRQFTSFVTNGIRMAMA